MISVERLQKIAFWANELTPSELARAASGISEKSWESGAYVVHRGDRIDYWQGVVSGLVKMSSGTSAGKAATLAGVGPGAWFGEGSILKNMERQYDIIALRECRIASMKRATFMWLYENSAGFNRFLVRQFNERLGQFIALIEQERMFDATARLARAIAWMFNPVLNPMIGPSLKISQEELGLLAGVSRQVANRALRELEEEGLLKQTSDGVEPIDLTALARYGD